MATDAERLKLAQEAREVLSNAPVRPVQTVLDDLADALESAIAEKRAAIAEWVALTKKLRAAAEMLDTQGQCDHEHAVLLEQNRVLMKEREVLKEDYDEAFAEAEERDKLREQNRMLREALEKAKAQWPYPFNTPAWLAKALRSTAPARPAEEEKKP